jgi:hypothetical protein
MTHKRSESSSYRWPSKIGQTVKLAIHILEVHDSSLCRNIADARCFRGFTELLRVDAGIFSCSRAQSILCTKTSGLTLGTTHPPVSPAVRRLERESGTYILLVSSWRMSGAMLLLLLCAFMAKTEFFFYNFRRNIFCHTLPRSLIILPIRTALCEIQCVRKVAVPLGYGTSIWLSVLKLPLKCAVVSLYSVVKQRLKCNIGKECNCLTQNIIKRVQACIDARGHHFQRL